MPTTRKSAKRRSKRIPAEASGHLIVLTGLEHIEAGKSIGRLCICTAEQNGPAFMIGPKRTGAALCPHCDERHPIVDFKTAVCRGDLDLSEGGYILQPEVLLAGLLGFQGPGVVEEQGAAMRAASKRLETQREEPVASQEAAN